MNSKVNLHSIFHFRLGNPILQTKKIDYCQTTTKYLFLVHQKALAIYQLPNLNLITQTQITDAPIIKILLHQSNIFLILENSPILYSYLFDSPKLQLLSLISGHQRKINDFTITNNYLATGSDDYTLRIWEKSFPFSINKVITGHKNRITILKSFREYIFSGDCGGQIKIWRNYVQVGSLKFTSKITDMIISKQNNELIVASQNNKYIQFFDIRLVENRINNVRKIDFGVLKKGLKRIHELDDFFLIGWDDQRVIFVQKYMNKVINQRQWKQVKNINSFNGVVMIGDKNRLYLQDLCK